VRQYEEKVRPILEKRCLQCHGRGPKVRGGFRLDSRAAVLKGGDLGPAVTLDQPEQSLLLQAIRYEDLEMPPGGRLPPDEVEALSRWVKAGLPWSSAAPAPPAPASGPAAAAPSPAAAAAIAAARRQWSHQPVVQPPVPAVKDPAWCRNPIDAFLL